MPVITPDVSAPTCQARTPTGICGAGPHATNPHMCAGGHFLRGNAAALKDGVRRYETKGTLPDVLRQTVEEFREAVIADRGGVSELSTLEAAYIRRLSEVETVARLLAADLATRGLTTPRGRVRGTFSRWLESLDRWDRLAQRVGTGRRSRTVSLRDYLASAPTLEPAEAGRTPDEEPANDDHR